MENEVSVEVIIQQEKELIGHILANQEVKSINEIKNLYTFFS